MWMKCDGMKCDGTTGDGTTCDGIGNIYCEWLYTKGG